MRLDGIDCRILELLSADGRITMTELARQIGMSAPSVTERARRLEDAGIIKGYRADIDIESLGFSIGAYVQVRNVLGRDNASTYAGSAPVGRIETREGVRVLWDDRFEQGLPRLPLAGVRLRVR
jgi:DNA-binding Lrp family transcriptional regulator